jgi:Carboxypeptidase regulatory-like domain
MPLVRNAASLLVAVAVTIAAAPAGAHAQGPAPAVLTGTVSDLDGHPLPGVYVDVSGPKHHAVTDDRGHFRITKLATDSLIMIVRRVGLIPLTFDLVLVPGENIVTVRMQQVPQQLDAIRTAVEQSGLFGVVGDTAYDVVSGATVKTIVHKASSTTNEKGQFFFDPVEPGADMIDVRGLGFFPKIVSFTMPPKGGQRVAVWLVPLPAGLSLDALRRASAPSNALVQELFEFGMRRRWANPARSMFATREQLAEFASGMRGSDALRYLPRFGTVRPADIDCIMVDGVMALGSNLDDFSTDEMETLEIIAVGALPPEDARQCRGSAPQAMSGGPPTNGVGRGGGSRTGGSSFSARRPHWAVLVMLRH